jgi:hypothetical protein
MLVNNKVLKVLSLGEIPKEILTWAIPFNIHTPLWTKISEGV